MPKQRKRNRTKNTTSNGNGMGTRSIRRYFDNLRGGKMPKQRKRNQSTNESVLEFNFGIKITPRLLLDVIKLSLPYLPAWLDFIRQHFHL